MKYAFTVAEIAAEIATETAIEIVTETVTELSFSPDKIKYQRQNEMMPGPRHLLPLHHEMPAE